MVGDKLIASLRMPKGYNQFNTTEDLVLRVKTSHERVAGARKTLAFFVPRGGNSWLVRRVRKRALRRGYSFLGYHVPQGMLSSDPKITALLLEGLAQYIRSDIYDKVEEDKSGPVEIIGTSLQSILATMVADFNPKVDRLHLLCPGHCLAEGIWYSIRTQPLRDALTRNGYNLPRLKNSLEGVSIPSKAPGLEEVDTTLHLSRTDRVIPYAHGIQLEQMLQEKGVPLNVRRNTFLGHYGTIPVAYLFGKILS